MGLNEDMNVTSMSSTHLRENFVKNLNGTTMGEVILVTSHFPLIAFVAVSLELLVLKQFHISSYKTVPKSIVNALIVYLLEALVIIVPITSMFTVFSDYIHILFILEVALITVIVISSISSVNEDILYWKLTSVKKILVSEDINSKKKLFITYFRSFVLLVTAVSILGVDFHVFPRRFAKTETYGVSLMDLGVGLFVVSNALVEKRSSSATELKKTLITSSVLIILGILRYVLVQRFDYQKHVTEYGVHWNFFFTLACVKLLSNVLLITSRGHSFVCGLILILVHQYCLSHWLESMVLSDIKREDWFSANREGIVSLGGYLSLHLIGITIANVVNPLGRSKYILNRHKLKSILICIMTSLFLLCVLYYFDIIGLKVSRRLANLPYVLWITAISLKLLALFLLVEFLSLLLLPISSELRNNSYNLLIPVLLEGINFNGLLFFLMSNLLTGLINVYVDVFNASLLKSILILFTYIFIDCAVVVFLYLRNICLKF